MKFNSYLAYIFLLTLIIVLGSCSKDNYDAPESKLTGRVVYQGQAIGVRSNSAQLQLWQRGYDFYTPIAVYINQDGAFSALLFDGDYKLTRLSGSGPWLDQTDSIDVHVKGNTVLDVPVTPYSVVSNATYQLSGTAINSSITIQKVQETSQIEAVRLYLFRTTLVDQNNTDATTSIDGAAVVSGQPFTASVSVPSSLANASAVYLRVGVKTVGVPELAYSPPTKVQLK